MQRMENRLEPEKHGYDYGHKMYRRGKVTNMGHQTFYSFFFNSDFHFAGFELIDARTDTVSEYTPSGIDKEKLRRVQIDSEVVESGDKTQLFYSRNWFKNAQKLFRRCSDYGYRTHLLLRRQRVLH